MLGQIEPAQFDEWWAFYKLEPWGDDWEQAAMIAAMVHNAGFTSQKIEPKDLIPTIDNTNTSEIEDASLGNRWRSRLNMQEAK